MDLKDFGDVVVVLVCFEYVYVGVGDFGFVFEFYVELFGGLFDWLVEYLINYVESEEVFVVVL